MKNTLIFIKKIFNNIKLKKIVNVYQTKYKNIKAQGFGDFIRGSIYLYHLCITLGLDFDINLDNHPISKYLILSHQDNLYDINNVEGFLDYNNKSIKENLIRSFIQKLNNCDESVAYVFINFIPDFDIENPKYNIIQHARNIISLKIEPQQFILNQLDDKLSSIGFQRKQYAVIHIRCGDFYMNIQKNIDSEKHKISQKHINDIILFINKYSDKNRRYLLIGDSNEVKQIIANKLNHIRIFNSEIAHLGETINPSDKSIIETLIDFNLMRFSNYVISFTAYGHGSGFSKYSSVLYDVPFKQILLKPSLEYRV